jgi:cytochrome c biogenesis protein
VWGTLTSVRFAVLQIIVLAVAGLIGTLVRQIPAFALRDPAAYASEISLLHQRYDPLTVLGVNVGPAMVDVFERLGFFRIFTAPWFSLLLMLLIVSIVVCTADRTPRLWRQVRTVRVEQPAPFFDLRLPGRARFTGERAEPLPADDVARVLRRRHFRLRRADEVDGVRYLYGDRNQYTKLATLFTHAGLIVFLLGGAVTGALGFETVLLVGEGQTAPVQPVGTPHNLLVKNIRFEAPRRDDGSFEDFRTDLAVYQDGREIARKTIRVNDPLEAGGFVFHQNTFGPSADLEIRDRRGRLVWTGPMLLAGSILDLPQGFMTIPGSKTGLLAVLDRGTDGTARLALLGLEATGDSGESRPVFRTALTLGESSDPMVSGGYRITWARAGAFTGMVVKRDPGAPLIWAAGTLLILGLAVTFYLPRRRVWARYAADGELRLAFLGDRNVDVDREFRSLLEELETRAGRRAELRA